jgi:hypothetical protein
MTGYNLRSATNLQKLHWAIVANIAETTYVWYAIGTWFFGGYGQAREGLAHASSSLRESAFRRSNARAWFAAPILQSAFASWPPIWPNAGLRGLRLASPVALLTSGGGCASPWSPVRTGMADILAYSRTARVVAPQISSPIWLAWRLCRITRPWTTRLLACSRIGVPYDFGFPGD